MAAAAGIIAANTAFQPLIFSVNGSLIKNSSVFSFFKILAKYLAGASISLSFPNSLTKSLDIDSIESFGIDSIEFFFSLGATEAILE
jgi:hypothetical protein